MKEIEVNMETTGGLGLRKLEEEMVETTVGFRAMRMEKKTETNI